MTSNPVFKVMELLYSGPVNIYATAESNDFKFDTPLGFGK